MNTLKKCILLGLLILNLIPYMQDGKVKWTMMEAGAQDYTYERVRIENIFRCENVDDHSDWFIPDDPYDEDCVRYQGSKICTICHKLFMGTSSTCTSCSGSSLTLTRNQIFMQDGINTAMNSAWDRMITDSYNGIFHEYGFLIIFNTSTQLFRIGDVVSGGNASCDDIAILSTPYVTLQSNECYVGHFHTHPPRPRPNCDIPRTVGASQVDKDMANAHGWPCVVWDFSANHLGNMLIAPHLNGHTYDNYGPESINVENN